jgi:large subunit ribosomal protein L25
MWYNAPTMEISAQKRKILKKKVKRLREQGLLPAVISSKDLGSVPLTLDKKEFERVYDEAGESTLIDVKIEGETPQKALISEVSRNPVSDEIIHANFHAVKLTERISAAVPLKIVGESPIVKSGEGMLLTVLDEIEVEALPQDLPPEIEVDVSNLTAIGQGITVGDLKIDRGKVTPKNDPEDLVVKVDYPEMEEEKEEEEVSLEEAVEATKEKPKEENEDENKDSKDNKGNRDNRDNRGNKDDKIKDAPQKNENQ